MPSPKPSPPTANASSTQDTRWVLYGSKISLACAGRLTMLTQLTINAIMTGVANRECQQSIEAVRAVVRIDPIRRSA